MSQQATTGYKNRWAQLIIGVLCMAMVANLQYGWTLFVNPMQQAHPEWTKAAIQLAFTIFIVIETWLVPVEGWLVDKFGPRPVVAGGAVLVGLSWVLDSQLTSLPMLYFAAAIGGIGTGCVYGTCVGNALKWFPDKRGLAAGLNAAGFGAGAAVTVIPIANMIKAKGYEAAFFHFGILQGVTIFVLAMLLVRPIAPTGVKVAARNLQAKRELTTGQMLKTPVFWLTYAMFVAVATGGLMATAQIGPMAKDFGVDSVMVTMFGATLPLLTMALAIDNVANGLTRPLCGFISDKIGRENTMLIVFTGEAVALVGLLHFGHEPMAFMFFAAMVFMCWGEIFSIFPAICADTFGGKYAAGNSGALYTAKGTASLIVPLASVLSAGGNWSTVFYLAAGITLAAAISAKFILAPYRQRFIANGNAAVDAEQQQAVKQAA
ncbi:MAG TPA: oxalate/formate MFS antiporter [Rhodocyclaceae bacterium]|jgi:OFA family oxalate/formate antiporter-like MFS transporter|nr:oxalate/formate MFS antiporter [Rhodocyclaceae bacterium]